jgi:hypothetical protein
MTAAIAALVAGTVGGTAQVSPQGEKPGIEKQAPPARQSPTGHPKQPAQTEPGGQKQMKQPAQRAPDQPGPGRAQTPSQKAPGTDIQRTQRQRDMDDPARAQAPGQRDRDVERTQKAPGETPTRAQQPRQPGAPGQQPGDTARDQRGPSTSVAVQLNDQQRTRIRQVITSQNVQKTARVNFDIRVGVRVPRADVRLFPVPVTIVQIVPAYRGYLYFYLEDEDVIVIVHPTTLEIVAVIPA